MDLISTRTIDITKLAMDGLMTRQKAVTSNIANVMTPVYQRKEVSFESQLKEIVEKDDLKTMLKEQNSLSYNPTSLDLIMNREKSELTSQQARYLTSNIYSNFNPQIVDDTQSGVDETGNNVELEKEVMDMTGVGLRYGVLSTLEGRELKNIAGAIKGEL